MRPTLLSMGPLTLLGTATTDVDFDELTVVVCVNLRTTMLSSFCRKFLCRCRESQSHESAALVLLMSTCCILHGIVSTLQA